MAKKKLLNYVFEPGVSKDSNAFPLAYALLTANKAFIQAQVVAFINYNITNSIAPYVGYTYAPEKCTRDVGYFIDAIAHDLKYGGNVKIRQVADYFHIDGEPMIRGNVAPEITGQQYIRDIINNFIFNNTTVTPTYNQTAVSQVTTLTNAEGGAAARITSEFTILGNVIQNGPTAMAAKVPGVSSIRVLEKFNPSEILLITDTNSGEILYNFADPANTITFEYKNGRSSGDGELLSDLDFPSWWQTTDTITTIYLSTETASLSSTTDLQIFVEEPNTQIRPWEFGTDAIERMRVATPQAMLDADFEYGLQPTKWQALGLLRSYPSFYEIPATDLSVASIATDASATTGFFGASLITVATNGSHGFSVGTPITVKGLSNNINGFSRAEGTFLVHSVPSAVSFTYYASAKVGTNINDSLFTSFVQIRQAGFYTGASIGQPTFSVASNGTTSSIVSVFDSPSGSTRIAYTGTAPTPGSPITGSAFIVPGTSVSGTNGAAVTQVFAKEDISPSDTSIELTSYTGIQAGMAFDDGAGNAIYINSISSGVANLSGPCGITKLGADGIDTGVTGTITAAIGSGATFDVFRSAEVYTVTDSEDSSSNGINYAIGDRIKIEGNQLGGSIGANDVIITVTGIDSGGAITNFSASGTAVSGGATYTSVSQTSTTSVLGTGAAITVIRTGGTGAYAVSLANGGADFAPGDTVTWAGTSFGGSSPANHIVIQVNGVTAGLIVDWELVGSPVGVSGDATYVTPASTNMSNAGAGAVFTIERISGSYTAQITNGGSDYVVGNTITILGTDVGGASPLNDLVLTVSNASVGEIVSVSVSGTPFTGDSFDIYPSITISEALTGELPTSTSLDVGAIGTIQVDFTSKHGLLPGATILTSITSTPAPDLTATATTLPTSGTWTDVAAYNGRFVAVRSGSTSTAVSTNGTTWTAGGNLTTTVSWSSIAVGVIGPTTYWVAIASGGTVANYSTDNGATWTAATLPSSGSWTSVAYFNSAFVAVRGGSTAAAYSTDGTTWTAATLPSSSNWIDVSGGTIGTSSVFMAVATGGTAAAYSVDNGANWTASTLPASTTWNAVSFGNSRFFTVARNTTNAAVSTNGTTWTSVTLPVSGTWNDIAFGDDNFVVVADAGGLILTSFTGETGSFTERTSAGSAAYEAVAFTTYLGSPNVFAAVSTGGTVAQKIVLTSANHQLAAGPFVITEVPTDTRLRYPARSTGFINTTATITGALYARPDTFFTHRPFDGGVQLGTGGPQHGSQAIRQSKKYIRYQSGKGMMYTTGALFAPSYNIASATAAALTTNSVITITTDDTDHGCQPGAEIEINGMVSFEYNGTYIVDSVISARTFTVRALVPLSTLTAELGSDTKMLAKRWHGSTVRVGAFDEQNGIFYQYDGQEMALVRRSSTQQLTGSVSVGVESNIVTGFGTRFAEQLKVGDKVVLRGMSHTVTSISSNTNLTIAPDWRGVNAISGAKLCLTTELLIPQHEWNIDRCDGTGPSGYVFDVSRMQMIGIQYSWYAAGFIEFMIRGADGKFIFLHRIRNSNVNTEAYMRTANLPVRYEVENSSARSKLKTTINSSATSITLVDASRFPTSGTVFIDNEIITYTNKSGDTLTGCTRAASLSNFVSGLNRSFTGSTAATHAAGVGVILISCTLTPTISHWGSALLTDGLFDEDRGYIFSYTAAAVSVTTTRQTAFMIRLAPSVSNALVGDLGERDLLNRAQLLLKAISIAADTGTGNIVVEGVLNPRNYPTNPNNIIWTGLSSAGAGGQPSFAQIALGGSINWGGTPITTATAAVSGAITSAVSTPALTSGPGGTYANSFRIDRNTFIITNTQYDNSGLQIGDQLTNATYLAGGRTISNIQRSGITISTIAYTIITMNANASSNSPTNSAISVTTQIPQTAASYASTNYLFFTNASWNSSGATVGTRVDPSVTQFPAGTAVSAVVTRTLGGQTVRRVTFTQNSNTSIAAAATITFQFGDPQFAQPGEQVFSFITNPNNTTQLDLAELKELTTTAIGGRGTFPNGPDVLAINVYKVSGAAVQTSIILRWGEAQA